MSDSRLIPRQSNRLLTLHTPLGPDVLLAEHMTCDESMGPGNWHQIQDVLALSDSSRSPQTVRSLRDLQDLTGFRLRVSVLTTDLQAQHQALLGEPVRLDWLTDGTGAGTTRCIHGLVTQAQQLGCDGAVARWLIVVEPRLRLLAHRVDSWVFQDQTVFEILGQIFSEHNIPVRWLIAHRDEYARFSLRVQYQESTLAFVNRLLAEEGLCYWFEHAAQGGPLGTHTLVICDHNALLEDHPAATRRFTQSASPSFKEDGITQLNRRRSLVPTGLAVQSRDYRGNWIVRSSAQRAVPEQEQRFSWADSPGAYAFETSLQAERIACRHLEALQAPNFLMYGKGTWRDATCGSTWKLREHPLISMADVLVTLAVSHAARNNFSVEEVSALEKRLGPTPLKSGVANGEAPLYEGQLIVQDMRYPVRAPLRGCLGQDALFDRPHITGTQTAVVVGPENLRLYTDRDHRIRVQFHWQRGARSSHQLEHPNGVSNAPASHSAFTWVRVAASMASVNSGQHAIPRVGQEVLVTFQNGDPDRPLVIGAVYGGKGAPNAQHNQVHAGTGGIKGNVSPWFCGSEGGHGHGAVVSGFKTQELSASQDGTGGYNQLAFDDTPGRSRIQLGTTQSGHSSWLNMGHLMQQQDNQHLAHRGHGLELITTAHVAIRSGSGLLISGYATSGGTSTNVHSMEVNDTVNQLTQSQDLAQKLTDAAQKHRTGLPPVDDRTDTLTAQAEPGPKQLPLTQEQNACLESLKSKQTQGAGFDDMGCGTTAAWARPDLLVCAPDGIAALTPHHALHQAGTTASLIAQQHVNLGAQRHASFAVQSGVSCFTYGKMSVGQPCAGALPGMQWHAAHGVVQVQAWNNTFTLSAEQRIDIQSHQSVKAEAATHMQLLAGGSGIRLEPSRITLTSPGAAVFKAAQKSFTAAAGASSAPATAKIAEIKGCAQKLTAAAAGGSAFVA